MRGLGPTNPFVVFHPSFGFTVGVLLLLFVVPDWTAEGEYRTDERSRAAASHAGNVLQTIRVGITGCAQAFWADVRGKDPRDVTRGRSRTFERSSQACAGP
ncbi:MAG: hypothetical protein U1E50_19505 [Caulobacteraceae bacterium]